MIRVTQEKNKVMLYIESYLINLSAKKNINLYTLADTIKKQLEKTYSGLFGKFELQCQVQIKPLYSVKLKQLYKQLVIAVVDSVTNNNAAEADFGGLLVKLNVQHIESFISGTNLRTLPHEAGHLLGLDHPHARALFDSVNTEAHPYEQKMTENKRRVNLMSQTWYIQKAGHAINESICLTENQVSLLLYNFNNRKLNNNYSIIKRFFMYHWTIKI